MITYLAIVLVILQILDALTTIKVIKQHNGTEANKVLAYIFDKIGLISGLILIKGITIYCIYLLFVTNQLIVLIVLFALYAWVVYHNYKQMK